MDHWYELWDSVAASLVGHYETQERALQVVRRSLAEFGPETVKSLVLIRESNDEDPESPEVIASGIELVALAEKSFVPAFAGVGPVISITGQTLRGVTRHPVITGNRFAIGRHPEDERSSAVTFGNAV